MTGCDKAKERGCSSPAMSLYGPPELMRLRSQAERSSKHTFAREPAGRVCTSEKLQKAAEVTRTLINERKRDCHSVRLYPRKHQARVQDVP